MNTPPYDKTITALLVVDAYNDFISEGGKIWPRIKAVAEANNCVPNMLEILNAARKAKLRVFYAMHHRYRPGDYETWAYIAPIQRGHGNTKPSSTGPGAANSAPNSYRRPARSSPRNIGVPAASPIPTSICSSKSTVSISSSLSG
jgi:nicotinamidase-related amidase